MRLLLLLLGVWGYSQVAPPQPTLRSTTIYPTTFIVETNDFITVINTRQPILKPILPIQQQPKTNREFWTPRTHVAPWKPKKTTKECKE